MQLLLKASNLFALSISSLVPQSVITQGISRPPRAKSLENFLSGSATLHDIIPPFPMNNEQVELIFFSKWSTMAPAFIIKVASSRQHESVSPIPGVHSS